MSLRNQGWAPLFNHDEISATAEEKLMNSALKVLTILMGVAAFALVVGGPARAQQAIPQLNVMSGTGSIVHIFPTLRGAELLSENAADYGPLVYNGGPVMNNVTTYAIFWVPPFLQNGGATSMSPDYQSLQRTLLADYPAHGIDNNNTQYSQRSAPRFIQNVGYFGGYYLDTVAYPASGCHDPKTPGNCLSDAQIRVEIKRVMRLNGWRGGLANLFLIFTSKGEGSCVNSHICAYSQYCAYHSSIRQTLPIIYTNQPYADPSVCQMHGTPSPHGNLEADTETTQVSHELTEAITDPLPPTGWGTHLGNEIGDLCAYQYGYNGWDRGYANEMWNGHFYELQMEFSNYSRLCVNVGP